MRSSGGSSPSGRIASQPSSDQGHDQSPSARRNLPAGASYPLGYPSSPQPQGLGMSGAGYGQQQPPYPPFHQPQGYQQPYGQPAYNQPRQPPPPPPPHTNGAWGDPYPSPQQSRLHKTPSVGSAASSYSSNNYPNGAGPSMRSQYVHGGGGYDTNSMLSVGSSIHRPRSADPPNVRRGASDAFHGGGISSSRYGNGGSFRDGDVDDDLDSPPPSPKGPVTSTVAAQMRCKVFLQQNHAQWKSLGTAKLKLYLQQPTNVKQLVVEGDKSILISTIVLTDGVERVGKTGVAIELSDNGSRTGIIYMLQVR
jgi:hypothetical protein